MANTLSLKELETLFSNLQPASSQRWADRGSGGTPYSGGFQSGTNTSTGQRPGSSVHSALHESLHRFRSAIVVELAALIPDLRLQLAPRIHELGRARSSMSLQPGVRRYLLESRDLPGPLLLGISQSTALGLADLVLGLDPVLYEHDPNRELTELEDELIEQIVARTCSGLARAWPAVQIERFNAIRIEELVQATRLVEDDDHPIEIEFPIDFGTHQHSIWLLASTGCVKQLIPSASSGQADAELASQTTYAAQIAVPNRGVSHTGRPAEPSGTAAREAAEQIKNPEQFELNLRAQWRQELPAADALSNLQVGDELLLDQDSQPVVELVGESGLAGVGTLSEAGDFRAVRLAQSRLEPFEADDLVLDRAVQAEVDSDRSAAEPSETD